MKEGGADGSAFLFTFKYRIVPSAAARRPLMAVGQNRMSIYDVSHRRHRLDHGQHTVDCG